MSDFSTKEKENQSKTQEREGLQEEENGKIYRKKVLGTQSLME